jgi:uncharacterized protein with PIN domain
MLRMLGLDTQYDNALHDSEIVACAAAKRRVVLTRDRELLKCKEVHRECYVHALKAEGQLQEVARRYAIARYMQPFSLCLHCNLPLKAAQPQAVLDAVPERLRHRYRQFMHCPGCDRIYWEGSHWERMRRVLAAALELPLVDLG